LLTLSLPSAHPLRLTVQLSSLLSCYTIRIISLHHTSLPTFHYRLIWYCIVALALLALLLQIVGILFIGTRVAPNDVAGAVSLILWIILLPLRLLLLFAVLRLSPWALVLLAIDLLLSLLGVPATIAHALVFPVLCYIPSLCPPQPVVERVMLLAPLFNLLTLLAFWRLLGYSRLAAKT